jgi:two-component system, cell cycle sensor histidine kinase PleC
VTAGREKAILPRRHTLGIVGAASIATAAVVGLFFWMAWHSRQIVIADTYVSSSNLAFSVQQFVARTIETIDLSLGGIVRDISLGPPGKTREIESLLAERVRRSPQITGLTVSDAAGRVQFSTGGWLGPAATIADREYFRLARDDDATHVVLADPDASGENKTQVVVSRRLKHRDGRFAGVVAATLNRDYVLQFFYILNIGERGIIALATSDGALLVRRPSLDVADARAGFPELFEHWLPFASSAVIPLRHAADGLWRIVGYQRVEKQPIVVLVALAEDDALANWRRTTLVQASVCAAIVLVFCLLAMLLHRQLRARALAHGKLHETVRELEVARFAAEESSRVKSQFLANMSHELRTPLNAIIGFSEIIRDGRLGPVSARYRDYAHDIHSSGDHLLRLINDVLDLAKVEAGRLELREEELELKKLFEDCRRLIMDRLTAGQLKFALRLPPNPPRLLGDELRLKQIVLNLLSNAVKFTQVSGRITLSAATAAGGGIAIVVSDTGIGMEPHDIPLALAPFRQLDGALARRFEGTGLGLPLARRLVELHGGVLTIASTKGHGTVVTVSLPARRVLPRAPLPAVAAQ